MISTASDTAESNVVSGAFTNNMSQDEEEKAALVRRLRQMEAEEEHDDMFDKPVPFGSGRPDEFSLAAAEGRPEKITTSISVSCDPDDGADHQIYADPAEDKRVGDLYTSKNSEVKVLEAAVPSQTSTSGM